MYELMLSYHIAYFSQPGSREQSQVPRNPGQRYLRHHRITKNNLIQRRRTRTGRACDEMRRAGEKNLVGLLHFVHFFVCLGLRASKHATVKYLPSFSGPNCFTQCSTGPTQRGGGGQECLHVHVLMKNTCLAAALDEHVAGFCQKNATFSTPCGSGSV